MKNFSENSVFQGKRKLVKILKDKKYIFNTVNSGHTVFKASASYSKILWIVKNKGLFNIVKNSGQTLFFRASARCSAKVQANCVFQGKRKFFHSQYIWICVFLFQVRGNSWREAVTACASSHRVAFAMTSLPQTVLVSACRAITFMPAL